MASPLNQGDPIFSGPLLRFVPNVDNAHYDYDEDRPTPYTWRLRRKKGETYLSLFREGTDDQSTSIDAMKGVKPNHAIYRVQAETLLRDLGATKVTYERNADDPILGHAHFGVWGWDDDKAERIAVDRTLTEQAKPPGPSTDRP